MRKSKSILAILGMVTAFALSAPARAEAKPVTVHVLGMVCQLCSQGIEKKFKARPEVESVHVDMDKKEVHLALKQGRDLDDETITEAIRDAGVNVEKIVR